MAHLKQQLGRYWRKARLNPVEALLITAILFGATAFTVRYVIEHSDWKATSIQYESDEPDTGFE